MIKHICSQVGYRHDCDQCPHGVLHDPIDSKLATDDNGNKVPVGKCNETTGYCWQGSHDRANCKCAPCGKIPEDRPMQCDCGSTDIYTDWNVGSDIDPSGEEIQHLDRCLKCGKERFWSQRAISFRVPAVLWGVWDEPLNNHYEL